jgi:hypothetical protein
MNSPPCEDLKTIDFQLEETFLLRADSFWIPRNIDVRNPFFPFQAVRAGIRNQRVQQVNTFLHRFRWLSSFPVRRNKARVSVKIANPVGFCPITGSFWPVA